jgi:cytochrome bd-type quinol oxidase subunit 2
VLKEPYGLIKAVEFVFVYAVIISSWVHTHLTALRGHPYRGWQGSARFVLDLIILFLLYYIMNKIDIHDNQAFADAFPIVFVFIFIFYSIWEILRFFQYQNDNKCPILHNKARMTLFMLIFFSSGALFYHFWNLPFIQLGYPQLIEGFKSMGETLILLYGFLPLYWYRWYMWDISKKIQNKKGSRKLL